MELNTGRSARRERGVKLLSWWQARHGFDPGLNQSGWRLVSAGMGLEACGYGAESSERFGGDMRGTHRLAVASTGLVAATLVMGTPVSAATGRCLRVTDNDRMGDPQHRHLQGVETNPIPPHP
jgi:hypothetical protein